ncbi:MAG: hypothetical protein QXN56_06375 [Candidatus Hadarchaeum sp.]
MEDVQSDEGLQDDEASHWTALPGVTYISMGVDQCCICDESRCYPMDE